MLKRLLLIGLLIFLCTSLGIAQDVRAVKIKKFLDGVPGTPLKSHIGEILYCADKFKLDYRLYLAIAGAESTYGKKFPKHSNNLTGICGGKKHFSSIYDNIYQTHKLIATGKWYKKYRATKNVKDLIYVYKGVPPYDRYIRSVRYTMDKIHFMPTNLPIGVATKFDYQKQVEFKLAEKM